MTKRMQKAGTVALGVLLLGAIVALTAFSATRCATGTQTDGPDGPAAGSLPDEADARDTYPEASVALRSMAYPFADDENYAYFYANVHDYLAAQPAWDDLIGYRGLLPAGAAGAQPFSIRQDVLYQNIRSWLTGAIYMHPYFKAIPGQMTLAVDYRVGIPERALLINATWSFPDDESRVSGLPKVYWDQFRASLSDRVQRSF